MYAEINDLYGVSGISERIDSLRELCSSVTGVQMSFLFLEAIGIQKELLPWEYAFDIPSVRFLGLSTPTIPFMLPDFFRTVSPVFWTTTILWATTSIFIPALFAYFYNLSTRVVKRHGTPVTVTRYRFDPLMFNVAKAIVTWVVYDHGYTFGLFDAFTILRVNQAMFGGYRGILVGSYVSMLAALYEAAQRK